MTTDFTRTLLPYLKRLERLKILLDAEHEALIGAEYTHIEEMTAEKLQILVEMDENARLESLQSNKALLASDAWRDFVSRLQEAKSKNVENGNLVNCLSDSIAGAIAALRGSGSGNAYDFRGVADSPLEKSHPLGRA